MPIYEYKCLDCGVNLEKMQKVSDDPLTVCESCGGRLEKQWSLSGFQFKGEGWYVTDYSAKKGEAKGESKGEAKSDSKPEKKSEKSSTGESTTQDKTASNSSQTKDSSSMKD